MYANYSLAVTLQIKQNEELTLRNKSMHIKRVRQLSVVVNDLCFSLRQSNTTTSFQ